MVRRSPDGGITGVLNDWDNAAYPHEDHDPPAASAHHRTGTPPFIARPLLSEDANGKPTAHLYHHDLESFFWILLWCCINFDLTGRCDHDNVQPIFDKWTGHEFSDLLNLKDGVIAHDHVSARFEIAVHNDFIPLREEWVIPLLLLYKDAHWRSIKLESDKRSGIDVSERLGGGHCNVRNVHACYQRTHLVYNLYALIICYNDIQLV